MPKLKESTKKLRAQKLSKVVIENDLNQSAAGRQLGVSRQTIQKRVNTDIVQDCLSKYLDSESLKRELKKVAKEGLKATKVISAFVIVKPNKDGEPNPEVRNIKGDSKAVDFIDISDHKTRHKFWHDLMVISGKLKNNGNGAKVSIVNIIYGHRK